jgi:HlyD family secretion protein
VTSNRLFRKNAMDRLYSPDQLDQVLRLTGPRDWVAIAAALSVLLAAGLWAWYGKLTTTLGGEGVIVRTGGVVSIAASGSGQIVDLLVHPGDYVRLGQPLAVIAQPALAEQIRAIEEEIVNARTEVANAHQVRFDAAQLQIAAIEQQRVVTEREIEQRREDERVAREYLDRQQQLYAEGLGIKQSVDTARQKVAGTLEEMGRAKARLPQLESDRFNVEAALKQDLSQGQARVADLERRLSTLQEENRRSTNVISPSTGEVIEVKTYAGATIGAGAPVVTIQPNQAAFEAIVYVAAREVKNVHPGMDAQLSPSTARREEKGSLCARVLSVAQYPSTRAALMRNFENESLVAALADRGPVTELRLALIRDTGTGLGAALSSGTLCDARIVVRYERPLFVMLPVLKGTLGAD